MSTKGVLVDTNVVSELARPNTHPAVQMWSNQKEATDLYLPATALAELRFGIGILPVGQRRTYLEAALAHILSTFFAERVVPFDRECAEKYGEIVSEARKRGITIGVADGQIAAIAAVHGFAVATRDVGPFEAAGVRVVNPWEF